MSGPGRPTIADVARLAGVSAKTVSRVFDGSDLVRGDTRERVVAAADQLRFRPNVLARDLRRGGVSSAVGIVIGDIENPFYLSVAGGAESELARQGLTMVLATTDDHGDAERRVVDMLLAQRVRALLLIPVADDQSYLEGERHLGTPIVSVDRPAADLVADTVVLANRSGMAEAVRALTAIGHRRIAFVANPSSIWTIRERLLGYRQAMAEAGVSDTSRWERMDDLPGPRVEAAVHELMSAADAPTAIVTGNNRATAAVLRQLRDESADCAVIGFDDFELAELLDVSVVAYDAQELGRAAARLALERLTNPGGRARTIELPTRLVRRGSGERPPAD